MRLAVDGAVVRDADDLGALRLQSDLDADGVRTALRTTGTGELIDADNAWLDLGVLRSRAKLLAAAAAGPDWAQAWVEMTAQAQREGRLSADSRSLRVTIER